MPRIAIKIQIRFHYNSNTSTLKVKWHAIHGSTQETQQKILSLQLSLAIEQQLMTALSLKNYEIYV